MCSDGCDDSGASGAFTGFADSSVFTGSGFSGDSSGSTASASSTTSSGFSSADFVDFDISTFVGFMCLLGLSSFTGLAVFTARGDRTLGFAFSASFGFAGDVLFGSADFTGSVFAAVDSVAVVETTVASTLSFASTGTEDSCGC